MEIALRALNNELDPVCVCLCVRRYIAFLHYPLMIDRRSNVNIHNVIVSVSC